MYIPAIMDKADAMFDDMERLEEHKQARRHYAENNQRMEGENQIKRQLSSVVTRLRLGLPRLNTWLERLEVEEPEFYNYIKQLELINAGALCKKHDLVANLQTDTILLEVDERAYELSKLAEYNVIKKQLDELQRECERREESNRNIIAGLIRKIDGIRDQIPGARNDESGKAGNALSDLESSATNVTVNNTPDIVNDYVSDSATNIEFKPDDRLMQVADEPSSSVDSIHIDMSELETNDKISSSDLLI